MISGFEWVFRLACEGFHVDLRLVVRWAVVNLGSPDSKLVEQIVLWSLTQWKYGHPWKLLDMVLRGGLRAQSRLQEGIH